MSEEAGTKTKAIPESCASLREMNSTVAQKTGQLLHSRAQMHSARDAKLKPEDDGVHLGEENDQVADESKEAWQVQGAT